ncbi:MAG: L,D-transpeptidase [Sphingobacteriales bacterium]|nr:MAG: L,D-transpeptidase [Sphingobacteriales bacterium]
MKRMIYTALLALSTGLTARAQGWVDQEAIFPIVETQVGSINTVEKASWTVYEYNDNKPNDKKGQWSELMSYIDSLPGFHTGSRRYIIEMTNRVTGDNMKKGRKLILPTSFPEDFRAYSPYPYKYEAAVAMPKLLVIDKYTQTFGAYENGELIRWGLVSTGRENNLTPPGRYNFNWKDEYRLSNAAPPGETWELNWAFNIDAAVGIHVHQYALPIASPASHGCIRMSEADAKWNFNWANGWQKGETGKLTRNGTPVMVINDNPVGRPAHWELSGDNVVSLVRLPDDPNALPNGSYAQKASKWESGW